MLDAGPSGPDIDGAVPPGPFTLRVAVSGGGRVTGDHISCHDLDVHQQQCTAVFPGGTVVHLTKVTDSASKFVGWNGDCSGVGGCSITMTADRSVSATFSQCPGPHLWTALATGTNVQSATAVAVDAAGNIFTAGSMAGTTSFTGQTLTSAGETDVFVTKHSPAGGLLWARRFGGAGDDAALGVATDSTGNVIVSGRFSKTMVMGTATLTSNGLSDAFVAKLSGATGDPIWGRGFGDVYWDEALAVAVMPGDDIAVTGHFFGTVTLGADTLSAGYISSLGHGFAGDMFVARFNGSDGTPVWGRRGGGDWLDMGRAIAVDAAGGIAVAGTFNLVADFGGSVVHEVGIDGDMFIAKYSASGAPLWQRGFGNVPAERIVGAAFDSHGDLVLAGRSDDPAPDLGGGAVTPHGPGTLLLAKLDGSTGAHLWSRGRVSGIQVSALALDAQDHIIVAGSFDGTPDFGGGEIWAGDARTPDGDAEVDAFAAKYAPDGAFEWVQPFGGPGRQHALGVAVNAMGEAVVAGDFEGTANFCDGFAASVGATDAFLIKLAPTPAAIAPGPALLAPPVAPAPRPQGASSCVPRTDLPSHPPVGAAPVFTSVPIAMTAVTAGFGVRAAIGDLDGDGSIDVLVTKDGYQDAHVVVLTNDGQGHLTDTTSQLLAGETIDLDGPRRPSVLDIDGDGRLDVYLPEYGADFPPSPGAQNHMLVHAVDGTLRDRTGTVNPIEYAYTYNAETADIDCDGYSDVWEGNLRDEHEVGMRLLHNEVGVLAPDEQRRIPADLLGFDRRFEAAKFCDIDRDGDPDLILGDATGLRDVLLINDGHGFFDEAPVPLPAHNLGPGYIAEVIVCADFDLDGWPDLAVAWWAANATNYSLWLNQHDGTFVDVTATNLPQTEHLELGFFTAADLNGDGWPDLIASGAACGGQPEAFAQTWINQGGGVFVESTDTVPTGGKCTNIYAIDANGDGKQDLLSLATGEPSTVLINATP